MVITEQINGLALLEASDGRSELYWGVLREKPPMSLGHNLSLRRLARQLEAQLDPEEYDVLPNMGHLLIPGGNSYIPNVCVVPVALVGTTLATWMQLEVYRAPLPLVVEVWSPATGLYDIDAKLPDYQERGDLEIWRLHPFDTTLTRWLRQPDGRYLEQRIAGGLVRLHGLPGVKIDLDALFMRG